MTTAPKHPARFSEPILTLARRIIDVEEADTRDTRDGSLRVLDPFAGVGRVHQLARPGEIDTVGIEIEPEWAALHPRTICADALAYMDRYVDRGDRPVFDVVFTSPCYGNRFADHHDAKDGSRRRSYKHDLGRDPAAASSATLHWGPDYRAFHRYAWDLVYEMLDDDGLFILNVSDHIRHGEVAPVAAWHLGCAQGVGFEEHGAYKVPTHRLTGGGAGENADARVDYEVVYVLRRPTQ